MMIEPIIYDYLIIDLNHLRPIPLRNNSVLTFHPDHQGTLGTTAFVVIILYNDRVSSTMLLGQLEVSIGVLQPNHPTMKEDTHQVELTEAVVYPLRRLQMFLNFQEEPFEPILSLPQQTNVYPRHHQGSLQLPVLPFSRFQATCQLLDVFYPTSIHPRYLVQKHHSYCTCISHAGIYPIIIGLLIIPGVHSSHEETSLVVSKFRLFSN